MPYVSMFFGIIIRMFQNDHNPPHFHAQHQGQRAVFDLEGNILRGTIKSRTAKKLIREWASLHQDELRRNWKIAQDLGEIEKIAPLD